MLTINYDQALIEVKKKQAKIIALKKGRKIFKVCKWLEDEITAETKDWKR